MKKQDDLRKDLNNSKIKFILAILEIFLVLIMLQEKLIIFSCCSFKEVPSCEFYPLEAVKTNVIGTQNLIEVEKK